MFWKPEIVCVTDTTGILPIFLPCSASVNASPLSSKSAHIFWTRFSLLPLEPTLINQPLTFHFHALEREMATHSSVLAWRIPGTGKPHGLPSIGSHRVRHDWSDLAAAAAAEDQKVNTFTFHFHALEKEMATHSSVLAWRIPGTGEPGGLPSMGSHRVRHDWSDLAAAAAEDQKY